MTIVVANQSFIGSSGRLYQANRTLIDDSHDDYVKAPAYFDTFVGYFVEYPATTGKADGTILTLTTETPGWDAPAVPTFAAVAATIVSVPEVPASPGAQDVVDALVALGLVTQAIA